MIPKLHRKGTSFRGAAQYLLHDKGGKASSDRVAWTESRNLATDHPHLAWRVMAATAMDRGRRKLVAGISRSGRPSNSVVLHLTLSWRPDEANGLTREDMTRAAHGALLALGAADRQALIVCHNDEPQPHVHLLVNRVSPTDGRMLASSYERLALSAWAQAYEEARQRVVCPERVVNNRRRHHGEFVRGKPDEPRPVIERRELAQRMSTSDAAGPRSPSRVTKEPLLQKSRRQQARHQRQRVALKAHRCQLVESVERKTRRLLPRLQNTLVRQQSTLRGFLDAKHQAEQLRFNRREESLLGRITNVATSLHSELVRPRDDVRVALRAAGTCLGSSTARAKVFQDRQRDERNDLERRFTLDYAKLRNRVLAEREALIATATEAHRSRLSELLARQARETVELSQLWSARRAAAGPVAPQTSAPMPIAHATEPPQRSPSPARPSPNVHAIADSTSQVEGSPAVEPMHQAEPHPAVLGLDFERIRREREAFRGHDLGRTQGRGRGLHLSRGDEVVHR